MSQQEYEVIANVSPRSVGSTSLFETQEPILPENVAQFESDPSVVREAKRVLTDAGFHVFEEASSAVSISVGGTAELFAQVFGAKLKKRKAEVQEGRKISYLGTSDRPEEVLLSAPARFEHVIEGAVIARPPMYFAPPPMPPLAAVHPNAYPYLTVPDGVATVLRATRTHRLGVTGRGINVTMIDTGWYRHPFFVARGYRTLATILAPGAVDAPVDENGHGTGESANVFACAPDATLRMVKMANDTAGAINAAVNANPEPHVISNSWGYNVDVPGTSIPAWLRPLEAAVASAVARGIVVCFAAGNGQLAFPASHPDVIAVGGVHVNLPDINDLEASSYVSSFASSWYAGRNVPDVCGLTGRRANVNGIKAPSILLPVPEDSPLDNIDPQTGPDPDGWGLFSGTSAACPQIAGIVALMLEKNSALTPVQVRDKLKSAARDIRTGTTGTGDTAVVGPDLATGRGLADGLCSYLISMGDLVSTLLSAPPAERAALLANGALPEVTAEEVEDFIGVLRAR